MSMDPCAGVESKLQPYLDRQLTGDEVSMIEMHLGECEYCRERYHFEAQLRETVKTVCCGDPVPKDLVDKVRLQLRGQRGGSRRRPVGAGRCSRSARRQPPSRRVAGVGQQRPPAPRQHHRMRASAAIVGRP